jgi:MutS domain V
LISENLAVDTASGGGAIKKVALAITRILVKVSALWRASAEQKVFDYGDFNEAQRAAYHKFAKSETDRTIDDQTWKDLMVEDLLKDCSSGASIHGVQMMHHTLRVAGGAGLHRGKHPEWLELDARSGRIMGKLRAASSEVATALRGPEASYLPLWAKRVHLIPWVEGALFVVFIYLQWWSAVFATLGIAMAVHSLIQISLYPHLVAWRDLQRELVRLLDVGADMKVEFTGGSPAAALHCPSVHRIKLIRRDIAPSAWEAIPGFSEYGDLLVLHSFAKLDKARDRLAAHKEELLAIFECLSKLEMHCCVARFRHRWDVTTDVQEPKLTKLSLLGAQSPMLAAGMKFSIELGLNGALITGKNGVGKSTLLRAVGLNLALARSFGFCVASVAELPDLTPWSSIHNEDSLLLGESLYMAEMRRANELIDAAKRGSCFFLVDELFRGTNNIESVAAASAVLEELGSRNLVVASSHNTILATILAPMFASLALRRRVDEVGNISLDLAPGVESETNGVAMMGDFALPQSVVRRAEEIASWCIGNLGAPITTDSRTG